jgi:hypothetical protein
MTTLPSIPNRLVLCTDASTVTDLQIPRAETVRRANDTNEEGEHEGEWSSRTLRSGAAATRSRRRRDGTTDVCRRIGAARLR